MLRAKVPLGIICLFIYFNQRSFCTVYGCKNSQLHAAFCLSFWLCVFCCFSGGGGGGFFDCFLLFLFVVVVDDLLLLLGRLGGWRKTRLMEQGSAFYFTLTSKTNGHWKYDHFWFPDDQQAIDKQIRKQNWTFHQTMQWQRKTVFEITILLLLYQCMCNV